MVFISSVSDLIEPIYVPVFKIKNSQPKCGVKNVSVGPMRNSAAMSTKDCQQASVKLLKLLLNYLVVLGQ